VRSALGHKAEKESARPPALRAYQAEAVEQLRDAYRHGARAPLLVLPTGGGKTVVFSHIAAAAVAKGRSVLVLVHRRELIRQAAEKLTTAGVAHGIIAPGYAATADAVQVASVQTLARRLEGMRQAPPRLVIVDEAHHAVAGQWRAILVAFPEAHILGVTATPIRSDGAGLGVRAGWMFDALVCGPSIADLMAEGHLVRPRVFAPAVAPDLTGIRTRGGDYEATQLAEAMSAPQAIGCAVEHYRRHAAGLPTVLFAASVRHAEAMAEAFRAAGIRAVAASGATPLPERDAAIAGLATGAVEVLCSCDLISEGLDVPAIRAVILLRPTKSLGLYLQQVGRGLRPADGKADLVVLDHAGNTLTHGLPDAPRRWSLDGLGPKPPPKSRTTKVFCAACAAVVPHGADACSACGASGRPRAAPVKHGDGTLAEVTAEMVARMSALRTRPVPDLMREARSVDDLAAIQRARGFKPGWVWFKARELGFVRATGAPAAQP
jgi:DNA repair protein RadD